MQKRTIPTWCTVLAMLLILPLLCGAATIYVRTDGNDTNDGLSNTPAGAKATFIGALFASGNNDTVVFAPGTYDAGGTTYGLSRANAIFRGSDPGNRAVLANMGVGINSDANGITFENLVFDGVHSVTDIFVLANGSQGLTLRNCELRDPVVINEADALRHGLISIEGTDNLTIEDCLLVIDANANVGNRVHMMIAQHDDFAVGFSNTNWTIRDTEFNATRLGGDTGSNCAAIYLWQDVSGFLIEGCTFGTVAESMRIVSTNIAEPPRTYSGFTWRNNSILRVEALNVFYMGSNSVYRDFVFQDNYVTNAEDTVIYVPGGGTAVVDGLEVSGNVFEDIGYDDTGTDRAISMDEVIINTTPGKKVVIRNNRFVRPSVGADECMWLNLAGPNLEITDNEFGNYQATFMLVDGAESLTPVGALSNVQILNNLVTDAPSVGLAIRCLSETVSNVVIDNNSMMDVVGNAIEIRAASAPNARIRNNTLTRCARGIQCAAPGAIISRNDVFDSQVGSSILLGVYTASSSDVSNGVVTYNICAGAQAGFGIALDPSLVGVSQNVTVANNTVVSNSLGGIRVALPGCHVYNNIIAFHPSVGLSFEATTPGAIGYNLLFNTLTGGTDYFGFVSTPLPGDVLANPQFENLAGRNYHLRPNSAAIGAGGAHTGGANLVANGSDLGALPTQVQNLSVRESDWMLYR